MLRIRRILRDYDDAGSLNSLIALWGFVDDYTFLTKAGHVGSCIASLGSTSSASTTSSVETSFIVTKLRFAA